ncbi:MAG: hypothetical protein K5637_07300 [Lachnospiraceae bacterium]|nr:hypothetical protein [Lachnospiraceae bacterium]
MALTLCIIAIIVSIIVGWKFKLNTGVIALAFAFIIGNLVMGMKVNDIIAFFPVTIVVYLISIALFFNYATENGTMQVLGQKLLYALGGNAKLIPIVIAAVSAIVGGLGAGASTPAIVGPFCFVMALQAGVSPVLCAVAITFGNLLGSNNPFNGYGGIIGLNLIKDNGVEEGAAMQTAIYCWINTAIIVVIVLIVFYVAMKGFKAKKVEVAQPPAFNPIQKKTCTLVIVAFCFMIIPAILSAWVKTPFIKTLSAFCQPQVVFVVCAVIAGFMKLADEKTVIRKMPINMIVMIFGVYTLIKVAAAAGLVDAISNALASSIPRALVPGAIVIFAAFLSFFSSSTSTVMPLMYPMVPTLAASLSLNPVALYTCIFFGGLSTACSPFSTGGAITIAACPDNEVKDSLGNKMIIVALIVPVITFIAAEIGLFNFFHV